MGQILPCSPAVDFLRKVYGWSLVLVRGTVVCGFLVVTEAEAEGLRLESAGVRFGFPARESASEFNQAEAFANWDLPWHWELGRDWHLQSRLDVSAGWLGDSGADAAIGAVGPSLVLGWKQVSSVPGRGD